MCRARPAAALAIAVALLCGTARAADDDPAPTPLDEIAALLLAYQKDPAQHRDAMIATLRRHREELPPGLSLMLADALVSAGRTREARRVLDDLLTGESDPPTRDMANLGLGWLALSAGDVSGATPHFEEVSRSGPHAMLAVTILGLIAARDGQGEKAVSLLNAVVYADGTPDDLDAVARLGMGYAYFWSGKFADAATTFDEVPRFNPESPLADDGSYGAAWSRYRAGDIVTAREGLTALAGTDTASPGGAASALVDLDPNAIFRAGVSRYEGQGGVAATGKLVAMLDRDGRALAAAALRRIDGPPAVPIVAAEVASKAATPAATKPQEHAPAHTAPPAPRATFPWLVLALAAVVLAGLYLRRRRARVTG